MRKNLWKALKSTEIDLKRKASQYYLSVLLPSDYEERNTTELARASSSVLWSSSQKTSRKHVYPAFTSNLGLSRVHAPIETEAAWLNVTTHSKIKETNIVLLWPAVLAYFSVRTTKMSTLGEMNHSLSFDE